MTDTPSTATPGLAPGTYRLDPGRSVVGADVKAMFGLFTIHGTFRLRSGEVTIAEDPARSSVGATIDATSFSSGNAVRDTDVLSPALLDASAYPEITFAGRGVRPQGTRWVVPGSVTARGVAVPTDLRMDEIRDDGGLVRFHAVAVLDRTQFGATKQQGMVGRDVVLTIDAVAVPA
jgi:polyisoprenoid-binding protein YceI